MKYILILIMLFSAALVIFFLIKRRKKKHERKILVDKIHKVSNERSWEIIRFLRDFFSNHEETLTPEGVELLKKSQKIIFELKSEIAKEFNKIRNETKTVVTEAKKEAVFDLFDRIDTASDFLHLSLKIFQREMQLRIASIERETAYRCLRHVSVSVRNDILFWQKVATSISCDISYLERRRKGDVQFSENEIFLVDYIKVIVEIISVPFLSEPLIPRLLKLKSL